MMYVKQLLESIILRVELQMVLEVDNKGAVDLIIIYCVGGRTCHMETRVILVKWKAGTDNSSDLYTKNLAKK
jgi:hypothetical protein